MSVIKNGLYEGHGLFGLDVEAVHCLIELRVLIYCVDSISNAVVKYYQR